MGMSGGTQFPCDWPWCDPVCCPEWEQATDAERDRAKNLATYLLWSATGRQYGRCPVTIRPCRRSCIDTNHVRGTWSGNTWQPILDHGRWYNVQCDCPPHRCSCTDVCEIDMEGWYPEPIRVEIDGEPIPLHHFRVANGRRLVWQGDGCFPECQDLSLPLGEPGTWAITYLRGLPVPMGGAEVTSELACELLLSCNPDTADRCRLPDNVTSVSRQGIDIEFVAERSPSTPAGFGIDSIDRWVAAGNPGGAVEPVDYFSPDVARPEVTTWP